MASNSADVPAPMTTLCIYISLGRCIEIYNMEWQRGSARREIWPPALNVVSIEIKTRMETRLLPAVIPAAIRKHGTAAMFAMFALSHVEKRL